HLRDGAVLQHTVPDAARHFGRAIIMPNLVPPVRNGEQAGEYRERILAARPAGRPFEPLMVLYLTDQTTPELIRQAHGQGQAIAAK
ncbi:dihydroorotase, partial [Salmonella enterica]